VVVFFHGGGVAADTKEAHVNVGEYFASLGFVGVNGTYRAASEITWPEAARDIGTAVTWVKENIAEYGGDPEQVFVIGAGIGATHVATYVFRPELMPAATDAPAGAILVSGSYSLDSSNVTDGLLRYYGQDQGRWSEMTVAGRISRTDVPVLLTMAEFDPLEYQRSTITLAQELMLQHGVVPRFTQLLGHNHFSQQDSIGTGDSMLTAAILDLIQTTTRE
jgi:triacylglycerol lipase